MAIAVVISGMIALTLTPALCALLLKPAAQGDRAVPARSTAASRWLTAHYLGGVQPRAAPGRSRRCCVFAAVIVGCVGCCSCACPAASCRPRTRATSSARSSLPDGATLGAHRRKVGAAAAEDAGGAPGGRARVRRQRLRPDRRRQQDQRGDDVHPAQALGRAHGRRAAGRGASTCRQGRAHAATASCSPSTRRRSAAWAPPAASRSTCRTAPTRTRRSSTQVLQDFMAELRKRPRAAPASTPSSGPTVPQLLRRGRPREGDRAGRAGQRRVRRAAEHDGRALRQRLQQVRPHLPRADAGRRARTARSPRTWATSTCARRRGDMIPLKALLHDQARSSARSRSSATTASSPPRCWAAARRAAARARRSPRSRRSPPRSLPPGYTIAWTGQAFQEKRTGTASIIAFALRAA